MQPQQPYYGPPQAPTPPTQPSYDFIMNPNQPGKRPRLGGPSSLVGRVLVVGVGLIIVIIVFAVIKGILAGGGNGPALLDVAEYQQSIVHLATGASTQTTISNTNKNFAVTAQLVVTSQQGQLLSYLKKQHQKVPIKVLNLKVNSNLDTQLTNAQAASTYDLTFQQILQDQLTGYSAALQQAYKQTAGANGRKLLTADYASAMLLSQQLKTTTS